MLFFKYTFPSAFLSEPLVGLWMPFKLWNSFGWLVYPAQSASPEKSGRDAWQTSPLSAASIQVCRLQEAVPTNQVPIPWASSPAWLTGSRESHPWTFLLHEKVTHRASRKAGRWIYVQLWQHSLRHSTFLLDPEAVLYFPKLLTESFRLEKDPWDHWVQLLKTPLNNCQSWHTVQAEQSTTQLFDINVSSLPWGWLIPRQTTTYE